MVDAGRAAPRPGSKCREPADRTAPDAAGDYRRALHAPGGADRGDLGPELTKPVGEGVARRGDHPHALAHQNQAFRAYSDAVLDNVFSLGTGDDAQEKPSDSPARKAARDFDLTSPPLSKLWAWIEDGVDAR